ncbi:uncharacterized protein LOC108218842 isoform X3 [Daucus carota subsp. sativus]|uniref:uncharacterized protein LOC108218842 isoform X3 n=1 Tax=Daucus carota subsp. sativus TaxID=79200 RepID=UPI003083DDDD
MTTCLEISNINETSVTESANIEKTTTGSATRTSQAAIPQGSLTGASQAAIPKGSATRTSQAGIPQGAELSKNGAAGECSNINETSVTESANIEKTTTGSATRTSQAAIPQAAQRICQKSNLKKSAFYSSNSILDIGKQDHSCGFCGARVWTAEFTGRATGNGPRGYSICCGKGKVHLPLLREAPPELAALLSSTSRMSKEFLAKIRIYNNLFAFCSFGGKVDHSVNEGKGPFVFRVSGEIYHAYSSLIPPEGRTPKYAQLYMYDAQQSITHRLNFPGSGSEADPLVVSALECMLRRENALVGIFRQARERFQGVDQMPLQLRLLERRTTDGRYENLPTENDYEFAGLVVDDDFTNSRDIVAHDKISGLKHISDLHPCFMSMQYPVLFPYGEDGYRIDIKHRNVTGSEPRKMSTVSQREYYAFRLQYRPAEGQTVLRAGRLFLQFIVDSWCSVERGRLQWVRTHQSIIRSDLYNNIVDSLTRGDFVATDVGKRVILPSSFTGGYRYMQQNFQDSLAVCKEYGHPDLFITFTCNPKWDEISEAVKSSGAQDASVRPDIVARVFKMKLDAMIADFTKNEVLGRVLAVVYTIEFQKRGLPHAHIVLWLAGPDKLLTPEDIDQVISAELPDEQVDAAGYKAVSQFMMHGPCGAANPKCPCMSRGRCTKHYPKQFRDDTVMDDDGYALYRRRDTKRTAQCNNILLDNRHVVPYHRGLLVKYQAHINVEWCNRSLSIKYLFKYIGKGPDTATFVLEKFQAQEHSIAENNSTVQRPGFDEVKNYVSCRYVSAAEASWRLFEFPIHHREPFVQRLYFHLENEQEVRFRDDDTVPQIVRRLDPDGTMFIQWLLNNRYDEQGRDLTFVKYPTKYRWDASAKRWFRRKKHIDVVGRMVYAHPASGERFYMRLLLNFVAGPTDFKDIRTVDGVVYSTYKEACFHRGLLESDKEWHVALEDASQCATASHMRDLFVTMLVFCEVSDPGELWAKHWTSLADDVEYKRRKIMNLPSLKINVADKQMLALEAVGNLLKQYGKKLSDFPGLPQFHAGTTSKYRNELLIEEMMYDREELRLKADENYARLNEMQLKVYQTIIESVDSNSGGLYFVCGPGGTGKTFLWSTIISRLRSQGRIVLGVASSGIASLLIEGGRTAHSRFKIPIDIDEFSCCDIKQNTYLAELLCNTNLVVWDEAPMNHRFIFEAVDRTFRDICNKTNPGARSLPFGGITMLLGGDLRQILPVVPKKGREDIVASTIPKSKLWQHCTVFQLTENMRIEKDVPPVTIDGRQVQFRDWILGLGDGREPTFKFGEEVEPSWIKIPDELCLQYTGDPMDAIIGHVYSDLNMHHGDLKYLRDRAILTPLNEFVHSVNNNVLKRLPGEFKVYKSCDTICKASSNGAADEVLYPPEYLNSLKVSGVPNHEIQIKVGAPLMLLRNLNPKKGLCNGTRLIVTRCYPFLIEALIITGNKIGETTYIPRIHMSPADKTLPFVLKRKQFPVSVCYAMTINKSQGQTMKNVGLFLPKPVFSHGHFYVAVSRVTSPKGLKIVCINEDDATAGYTKNIVYPEIFEDLL